MKRSSHRKRNDRRYRGKKPGSGLTPEQAGIVVLAALAAILVMTMKVNSQWCGMTVGEQVHEALFVTKDWE